MSDVRLTATNPEDSSIVPVACNTRGELLIEDVKIEQIDNDVTINGNVSVNTQATESGGVDWLVGTPSKALTCYLREQDLEVHQFFRDGKVIHQRYMEESNFLVVVNASTLAIRVIDGDGDPVYQVDWSGNVVSSGLRIMLDPDNPVHFSSVRNTETGEEVNEYIGPVLDVRKELEFLRAQVRALMEKQGMSPEGGWPAWDGESAS